MPIDTKSPFHDQEALLAALYRIEGLADAIFAIAETGAAEIIAEGALFGVQAALKREASELREAASGEEIIVAPESAAAAPAASQEEAQAEACPVAALGPEFKRRLAVDTALDERHTAARGDEMELARLDRLIDNNMNFLRQGLRTRATFDQAKSAEGALLQIGFLSDFVDDLEAKMVNGGVAEDPATKDAINRLFHSIASFIEATTGARREDVRADYFLERRYSPFAKLDEAERLAAEKSDEAQS